MNSVMHAYSRCMFTSSLTNTQPVPQTLSSRSTEAILVPVLIPCVICNLSNKRPHSSLPRSSSSLFLFGLGHILIYIFTFADGSILPHVIAALELLIVSRDLSWQMEVAHLSWNCKCSFFFCASLVSVGLKSEIQLHSWPRKHRHVLMNIVWTFVKMSFCWGCSLFSRSRMNLKCTQCHFLPLKQNNNNKGRTLMMSWSCVEFWELLSSLLNHNWWWA